jgi:hypothetical protein
MINELVNNYEENKAIVDNLNIHFLPMANPDGYEYSRNSDRMWRKNRNRDNKAAGGTYCWLIHGQSSYWTAKSSLLGLKAWPQYGRGKMKISVHLLRSPWLILFEYNMYLAHRIRQPNFEFGMFSHFMNN